MKKALIILAEGFEEIEAVTSFDVLVRSGIGVAMAGLNSSLVTGSRGLTVDTDIMLKDVETEYDALILPGGQPGADNLAASKELPVLLKQFNTQGRLIAAICASPAVVLAKTGILNGRTATCFPGLEKAFPDDVIFMEDNVVVDGNIITSRGPATAMEFALTIAGIMSGDKVRDKVSRGLLYT